MSTVSALQGLCLILLITADSCVIEQWVVLGDAACAGAAPEVGKSAKGSEQSAAACWEMPSVIKTTCPLHGSTCCVLSLAIMGWNSAVLP